MARQKKLIAFNWKENPASRRDAVRLFRGTAAAARGAEQGTEIAVFPPFLYLAEFSAAVRKGDRLMLGAQDVFWESQGAYTGEIGPSMLRDLGPAMHYAIIGHSERRQFLGETDEMINRKVRAALASGLRVILCVGEQASIRRNGAAAAERHIKEQVKKALRGIGARERNGVSIAYEPIWAIGTGRHCPPEEAVAAARAIRSVAGGSCRVLYGGSVDGATAGDYLCYTEINGVLVGGASLRVPEVKKIIKQSIIHG